MTDELLGEFKTRVEAFTLQPSTGGMFEIKVNDQLIFSKKELGRYPNEGEILEKVKSIVK